MMIKKRRICLRISFMGFPRFCFNESLIFPDSVVRDHVNVTQGFKIRKQFHFQFQERASFQAARLYRADGDAGREYQGKVAAYHGVSRVTSIC